MKYQRTIYRNNLMKRLAEELSEHTPAEDFLKKYDDCKNEANGNKVSPLVIVYKKDLDSLMSSTANGQELLKMIAKKIEDYNNEAKNANVPQKFFNYVGPWLDKFKAMATKPKMKKLMNAVSYFTNCVLSGDGMAVASDNSPKKTAKKKSVKKSTKE